MLKPLILTSIVFAATAPSTASDPKQEPGDSIVTTNRLATEKSPYLLQHANNPVDWYPWSEEAFKKAAAEDKPIFLSIGYATCHWCHVMEHESFEDPIVAALMNDAFINIKVDREERPDIDQVYMTVCQMLTGSGGWPLTILMTPDKQPFFAGTYFPRESRHGRIGMLELVPRVQTMWQSERAKLLESADQIVGHLEKAAGSGGGGAVPPNLADITYQQLEGRYDPREGGFGDRPKFPSPHNLTFLIEYWQRTSQPKALEMTEKTLEAMRLGGIYDHIGFGFHRYSTDSEWLVPHFEKMLYDQAMLTLAYTEAFAVTEKPAYARTVREILDYVRRDMTAPEGGFYSAEDADSEGEEGLFYLWTVDEINQALSVDEARLAVDFWNVSKEGNYLDESTRQNNGRNILHLQETDAEAAKRIDLNLEDLDRRVERTRESLFIQRELRVHPLKDDKVLADWNGLMAAAMARAGRVLGDPAYIAAARKSLQFVLTGMRTHDGHLLHRYRDGEAAISAFLDDYVFLTWACIELYDATLEATYLDQAVRLATTTVELFWDPTNGGLFLTSDHAEELLVRPKEVYDGAIPSGNSVALFNFVRLGRLTGRSDFSARADAMAKTFSRELRSAPAGHTHMVSAIQRAASPSVEVVIVGASTAPATEKLIEIVRSNAPPHTSVLLLPDGEDGALVRKLAPFTEHHVMIDDLPTAYVCRDFACKLPTTDPEEIVTQLRTAAAIVAESKDTK